MVHAPQAGHRGRLSHACRQRGRPPKSGPRQRLWDAIDTAVGGLPAAITTEPAVLRGKPGQVLTDWPAHGPVEHPREPAGQRWGRQAARFSRPP
jgi:hypothetical protein